MYSCANALCRTLEWREAPHNPEVAEVQHGVDFPLAGKDLAVIRHALLRYDMPTHDDTS